MTNYIDPEDPQIVVDAKKSPVEPVSYSYTERDVILYNIGVGATEKELRWTYEGDDQFAALPTFGVVPQFQCMNRSVIYISLILPILGTLCSLAYPSISCQISTRYIVAS